MLGACHAVTVESDVARALDSINRSTGDAGAPRSGGVRAAYFTWITFNNAVEQDLTTKKTRTALAI